MKLWQFFFLLAAVYLSPRVSSDVGLELALIFTTIGLFCMSVSLWKGGK